MKRLSVPLACLALTACSMTPALQVPPTPSPQAYKVYGEWRPASPADRLPKENWWIEYGQPELDALESELDQGNPDLQTASARYREAVALSQQAQAALLPAVTLSAYDLNDRQSDTRPLRSASQPARYRDAVVGGAASYELDLWGRVRSASAAGRAAAEAAKADLESVRLLLHAQLANVYIELRGADDQLAILRGAVEAYRRARELTKNRYEGGIASALDLARAQTQLESAQAELTDTLAGRALYENALAALTGRAAAGFSIAPRETTFTVPQPPLGLPSELLERRPDVAAAERRMSAYNESIGVAKAAFYPRISLSAVGGFQSNVAAGLLSAPNRLWAVGPQGFLTLLDGGYRSAVLAAAKARLDQASGQYRGTVISAFREVGDALALVSLLDTELVQREAARTSAEHALSLALDRYQHGAISYLEVVTAQVSALEAQRKAAAIRTRQLQASVALVRAVGGGYHAAQAVSG